MTFVFCPGWFVFHDPVTEACFGDGKMKELEPAQQFSGDQAWGSDQGQPAGSD